MSQDIRTAVEKHPLFSRLTNEQSERVISHARCLTLPEGDILFRQQEPAKHFYFVRSGTIKLSRLAPDGNEKVIEFTNAGQTFAEALMFLDVPAYPVNASALAIAELICFDSRDFASMLRDSVDTCFMLMADMSQRLHSLIAEIDNLSLQNGSCRVASYLLKMAPEDSDSFALDIPKGVMASRLSIKPETFSRILRNLQDNQILSIKGSKVTLLDRNALKLHAENLA